MSTATRRSNPSIPGIIQINQIRSQSNNTNNTAMTSPSPNNARKQPTSSTAANTSATRIKATKKNDSNKSITSPTSSDPTNIASSFPNLSSIPTQHYQEAPRSSIPRPLGAETPFYSNSSYPASPLPPPRTPQPAVSARTRHKSTAITSPSKKSTRMGPDLSNNASGKNGLEDEEWDMPPNNRSSSQDDQEVIQSVSGTGGLNWQEEIARLAISSPSSSASLSRANNGRTSRKSGSSNAVAVKKAINPHNAVVAKTATPSNLNWQEALSQQQTTRSYSLPNVASPAKSASNNHHNNNNRRQQILDESTFGPSNSSSSSLAHDVFSSSTSASLRSSPRPSPARRPSPNASTTTPTRPTNNATSTPAEPRYAGPTFHNSPAPSSLGIPNFLAEKRAAEAAMASRESL